MSKREKDSTRGACSFRARGWGVFSGSPARISRDPQNVLMFEARRPSRLRLAR